MKPETAVKAEADVRPEAAAAAPSRLDRLKALVHKKTGGKPARAVDTAGDEAAEGDDDDDEEEENEDENEAKKAKPKGTGKARPQGKGKPTDKAKAKAGAVGSQGKTATAKAKPTAVKVTCSTKINTYYKPHHHKHAYIGTLNLSGEREILSFVLGECENVFHKGLGRSAARRWREDRVQGWGNHPQG